MVVARPLLGFGGRSTEKAGRKGCWLLHILFWLLLLVDAISVLSDSQYAELKSERAEAAKEWAPLVYLHPKETIFPTAVHTFLKNVVPKTLKKVPGTTESPPVPISRSLNTQLLPEGHDSENSFLIAPIDPGCGNCALPKFLFGEQPSVAYAPPVYAIITSCLPPRDKKAIDRSSKYGLKAHDRRRLGKRIKDTIIRAGSHIRKRYLARRNRKKSDRRLDSLKNTNIKGLQISSETDLLVTTPPGTDDSSDEIVSTTVLSSTTEPALYDQPKPNKSETKNSAKYNSPDAQTVVDQLFYYSENINLIDSDIKNIKSSEYLQKNLNDSNALDIDVLSLHSREENAFSHLKNNKTTSSYTSILPSTATNPKIVDLQGHDTLFEATKGLHLQIERKTNYETHPHWKHKKFRKGHHFTITYWMFYPFSRGKTICTSNLWLLGRVFKPRIGNKCYGDEITVNDHVGDWEHISIFFENGLPERMYISAHYFGSFYKYNHKSNTFEYVGKDTRNGLPLSAKFPPVVKSKGTHPIVFSALGSHGLWGGPGNHRYLKLIKLMDETEAGTPWKTWKNIDIIDYRDSYLQRPDRQWLKYHGRWGNPSFGCHKGLFGICYMTKGPTGIPEKRENFPCHKPDHSTFQPKT